METVNPYVSPTTTPLGSLYSASAVAVSPGTIAELSGTRPWVRLLAILTWISCVLLILVGVGLGGMSLMGIGSQSDAQSTGVMVGVAFFYCLLALLLVYPAMKMNAYVAKIDLLVRTGAIGDLEAALSQQRLVWRFYGILALVYIVVVVIGFAAAIAIPILMK